MNNEETLQTTSDSNHKIRYGLHATNLKFGEVRKDGTFNYDGIDLSLAEDKALFAIIKLLDKTNYEGNAPGIELQAYQSQFNYEGKLPRITFTPSEYLESYGLEKRKTSRGYMEYSSNERRAALDALKSLAMKNFRIVYKRETYDGKREPVIDRIETYSPLIKIYSKYFGLTKQEDEKLDSGGDASIDEKAIIGVQVYPILVDQIDSYYTLLDPRLHTITKEILGKKYSKHIPLFIEWLTVQSEFRRRKKNKRNEIVIGLEKLAARLRMYDLLENYDWKKIKQIVEECFAVGRGMRLLDSGVIEDKMVKISLSPKSGISTHKKGKLYPKNLEALSIKSGSEE